MTFDEWAEENIHAPLRGHAQAGSDYVEEHKKALLTIAKSAWEQATKNHAVSVADGTTDSSISEDRWREFCHEITVSATPKHRVEKNHDRLWGVNAATKNKVTD